MFAAVAILLLSTGTPAQSLQGRVTAVSDGDTIAVATEDKRRLRIRLQGIDAPEHTMPYSQISRRHLLELVRGKVITFNPEKLDRHGRIVAVVRLLDGTDVCLEQIKGALRGISNATSLSSCGQIARPMQLRKRSL